MSDQRSFHVRPYADVWLLTCDGQASFAVLCPSREDAVSRALANAGAQRISRIVVHDDECMTSSRAREPAHAARA
jgi:hypothetical protein